MIALSAADAISPALQRTREFLFRPFRLGTYLKLCLVALLTEAVANFNVRSSTTGSHIHSLGAGAPFSPTPAAAAAIALAAVLLVLLSLGLFFLITRLRFAYFYCLTYNVRALTPGWRIYRSQALRFFWMNLIVGLAFVLLALLVLLPFLSGLWTVARSLHAGRPADVGAILAYALPLIPIVILLVLAAIAVDVVLRDLMLPHYALENAGAAQAWRAVRIRIAAEKGAFLRYALVRVFFPIVAVIALGILFILPAVLSTGLFAAVELGIHSAFAGPAGTTIPGIVLEVFFGVAAFCVGIAVVIGVCGPVSTSVREYALLFYGGRFQPLGDLLTPLRGPAPALGD